MSCLDVMYQVYGTPPQPYFAAACSPYHHQKLAFYSKMQEPQHDVSSSRSSGGSSGSSGSFAHPPPGAASIKEEEDDCGRDRDRDREPPPPEAEYLSARCVVFTYFQGDISAVVDQHFSRALGSHPSSSSSSSYASSSSKWTLPNEPEKLSPVLLEQHLPVLGALRPGRAPRRALLPRDPYSASLHGHLHQPSPDVAWHPSHHHHHHHHHPYSLGGAIGSQGSGYPRPGVHEVYGAAFDPRYGSLLVPSVRPHHRLAPGSAVPGPSGSPCDLGAKGESGGASAWSGPFSGAGPDVAALNMDTGTQGRVLAPPSWNPRARSRYYAGGGIGGGRLCGPGRGGSGGVMTLLS
ncbi:hypothetical protein CRUP_036025 [Coryphaenoides rupestris]|nr:hypothetical protein CRUP_036025 [Coryphaenoides rupestris]